MAKRKKQTRRRKACSPVMYARRCRSRRKTGLSEIFTPATAKAAAQTIGAGALGGLAAGALNRVLTKQNNITRYGIEMAVSFVTYAVFGYPNMAAGMAGAFTAVESNPIYSKFLAEDNLFADDNSINELPLMMNENGEVISLQEDQFGDMVYLNEATGDTTLAEEVYLQEDVYLQENDSIYPEYSTEY